MTKIVNKNKKTKTKYDIAFVIMAVLAFLIIIGTGTYAYYQSTIAGATSGTIAKWSFKVNDQTSTFDLDFGALYPGKNDVKYIELSAEDSELPVAFELIFNLPNFMIDWETDAIDPEGWAEAMGIMPKLSFDVTYPIAATGIYGLKGMLQEGEKITIPIYYNWSYDANDADDIIQEYAAGNNSVIDITIIGRQLDISSTEAFNESLNQDLLGLNDTNTCEMGEYSYSNRYGYPCDRTSRVGATIHIGEIVNYELADGSVIELPKYKTQEIIIDL